MNIARYVIGVALLMALPPGIFLWFAIHPFARFWRRIGAGWTYTLLSPFVIAWMVVSFVRREALLGANLGTQLFLLAPAAACLATGIVITVKRRRQLSSRIVAGLPELSREKNRGKLITEGIYAKIRHPRYMEVMLFTAAYAFFANYVGLYVIAVLSIPALYLVVLLEERELRDRFGVEYEEYCRRVPRFVPLSTSSKS